MTLAAAQRRWTGKAEVLLATRLRDAVASETWASTLTIHAGADPQASTRWQLDVQRMPAIDVWCDSSDVTEYTLNATAVQVWVCAATVAAVNSLDHVAGERSLYLASLAAELLARYGSDPTNQDEPASCIAVRVLAVPLAPPQFVEGAGSSTLGAWRTMCAIQVVFEWTQTHEWTCAPNVQQVHVQAPPSGSVDVGGEAAELGRTTTLAVQAAPVVIEWPSVADGSSAVVSVTLAGSVVTETQTTTSNAASFATVPASGAVWTVTVRDATTSDVFVFAIEWS